MKNNASGNKDSSSTGELSSQADSAPSAEDGLDDIFGKKKVSTKKKINIPDPIEEVNSVEEEAAAVQADESSDVEEDSTEEEKTPEVDKHLSDDDKYFSNNKDDDNIFIGAGADDDPWFTDEEEGEGEKSDPEPLESEDSEDEDSKEEEAEEVTKPDKEEEEASESQSGEVEKIPTPVKEVKQKKGCWNIFTTLFFFASFFMGLILAAAVLFIWMDREGIAERASKGVEDSMKSEIEAKGVFLSYDKLDYDLSKGFTAENVTVFQSEKREKPVLKLSRISFDSDIAEIARQQLNKEAGALLPDTLTLKEASLTLFAADGKEVTTLKQINGDILVSDKAIETERLTCSAQGLRVNLSGKFPITKEKRGVVDFAFLKDFLPWIAVKSAKKEGSPGALPPVLDLRIDCDSANPDEAKITGTFQGSNFIWREIPVRFANISYQYEPSKNSLNIPEFQVGYGSGNLSGNLTIHTKSKVATLTNVRSTADPIEILSRMDPGLKEKLKPFALVDFPTLILSGTIPFTDPMNAVCKISIQHDKGLTCSIKGRKIPIQTVHGNLKFDRGSIDTRDLTADILGGSVQVNGAMNLNSDEFPFNGLLKVDSLPLEALSPYLGKGDVDYSGDLSLTFQGSGNNLVTTLRGGGKMSIENGNLSRLPVVGPVQNLVSSLVPALASKAQGDLKATLLIESGVLISNDITIPNDGSRTIINGDLNLDSLETSFQSSSALVGITARAMKLEEKALTIRGSGPVMNPKVAVQDLPTEFAASDVREILQIPVDGVIAQAINQLSADSKKDKNKASPDAKPVGEGEEKASSVDESIMSIFRKSADDLKAILESVETPKIKTENE